MQRVGRDDFSAREVWMIGRVRKVPGLEVYRILGRILHADGLYVEDGAQPRTRTVRSRST